MINILEIPKLEKKVSKRGRSAYRIDDKDTRKQKRSTLLKSQRHYHKLYNENYQQRYDLMAKIDLMEPKEFKSQFRASIREEKRLYKISKEIRKKLGIDDRSVCLMHRCHIKETAVSCYGTHHLCPLMLDAREGRETRSKEVAGRFFYFLTKEEYIQQLKAKKGKGKLNELCKFDNKTQKQYRRTSFKKVQGTTEDTARRRRIRENS